MEDLLEQFNQTAVVAAAAASTDAVEVSEGAVVVDWTVGPPPPQLVPPLLPLPLSVSSSSRPPLPLLLLLGCASCCRARSSTIGV